MNKAPAAPATCEEFQGGVWYHIIKPGKKAMPAINKSQNCTMHMQQHCPHSENSRKSALDRKDDPNARKHATCKHGTHDGWERLWYQNVLGACWGTEEFGWNERSWKK